MLGLGKNRTASYVDLHNSAVIRYRRYCKTFIWVGIIGVLGLMVGIIQHYIQGTASSVPFYYCFGVCDFFLTLFTNLGMNVVWFWIVAALLVLATSSGSVLLGVFSSYGKKWVLFTMLGCYLADWIFTFLAFFIAGETVIGLMINAGMHIVVSFFLIMALYQYYNVINIEKRFKNIPTVAEQKEKEAKEKENGQRHSES